MQQEKRRAWSWWDYSAWKICGFSTDAVTPPSSVYVVKTNRAQYLPHRLYEEVQWQGLKLKCRGNSWVSRRQTLEQKSTDLWDDCRQHVSLPNQRLKCPASWEDLCLQGRIHTTGNILTPFKAVSSVLWELGDSHVRLSCWALVCAISILPVGYFRQHVPTLTL